MLFALYIALVAYTYLDARRRIEDPVLVACATVGSLIPFIGTIVYTIVRPPEFIDDARERELEIRAAELRVRQLSELSCPNCGYPGREELPALPELPAAAQGPLPQLRQAGRPALGALPLLRVGAARARPPAAAAQPQRRGRAGTPRRRRERAPEPRRRAESKPPPRGKRAEARQRSAQREAQRRCSA